MSGAASCLCGCLWVGLVRTCRFAVVILGAEGLCPLVQATAGIQPVQVLPSFDCSWDRFVFSEFDSVLQESSCPPGSRSRESVDRRDSFSRSALQLGTNKKVKMNVDEKGQLNSMQERSDYKFAQDGCVGG